MKLPFLISVALVSVLPALAKDQGAAADAKPATAAIHSQPPPASGKGKPRPRATTAATPNGVTKPSAGDATAPSSTPVPTSVPQATSGNITLDAYLQALTDAAALSKDEQKDIKTYYLNDGTKLNAILNDASLSPFQQMQQVDDLRDTRNAKIQALLRDADRRQAFLKTEAGYRVALTKLAATSGLVPKSTLPSVPQPTATPPGQAEKADIPGGPPASANQ